MGSDETQTEALTEFTEFAAWNLFRPCGSSGQKPRSVGRAACPALRRSPRAGTV